MYTTLPTVSFATLEDLLEELAGDLQDGKTIHGVRVTTDFRTRGGEAMVGEETTVSLIVTTCISETQSPAIPTQYGLWSWRIVSYAQVNRMQASNWTQEQASALADLAVEAARRVIEQHTGIRPKTGMYLLADSDWLTIRGVTRLIDLRALGEAVKTEGKEGTS